MRESQRKRNIKVLLRTPAAAPARYLRMQRQGPGVFFARTQAVPDGPPIRIGFRPPETGAVG